MSAASPAGSRRTGRTIVTWTIGALLLLAALGLAFYLWVWPQIGGSVTMAPPTNFGRVVLEPDPRGAAIALVLQNQAGGDTAMTGELAFQLQEPDGAIWRATRSVTPASFQVLPAPSLLAGRLGYRIVVPDAEWARLPRRGGQAQLIVTVRPVEAPAFSTTIAATYP